MILESWEIIVMLAMSFLFVLLMVIFGSGPAFAWNDRWMDRTRNAVSDSVISKTKED